MIQPFQAQPELEQPLIDLNQTNTVAELLALAEEHPEVRVKETRGVAQSRNKRYVRFAIFDVVTRVNGRLYLEVETTGPTQKVPDAPVESWRTGKRSHAQEYVDLSKLHEQAREHDPDIAERTDKMCARLFSEHPDVFALNYRAERTWLTTFSFLANHSLLGNARPNAFIYIPAIYQALTETFGIRRWADLRLEEN